MKFKLFFTVFFTLCISSVNAQTVLYYDGPYHGVDQANAIRSDNAGNVYVTGSSYSANHEDFLTIKYSITGQMLWNVRYDGQGHDKDIPYAMTVDPAGNVYVCGTTKVNANANSEDYVTIKYNSAGVMQWGELYDGPNDCNYSYDVATAIDVDPAGNVYITGSSRSTDYNDDIITVKYSPTGTQLWTARYNGSSNKQDWGRCIKVDGAGNIIVAGSTFNNNSGYNYIVLKYTSAGSQIWAKTYNGPGNGDDSLSAMALDNAGNIYVTGSSKGTSTGMDYATVKFNSAAGDTAWVARFNGTANSTDFATSITLDNYGGIYVTGACTNTGSGLDYVTIKYGVNGVPVWTKKYNGTANGTDRAVSVKVRNQPCGLGDVPCYKFFVYVTGQSAGTGSMSDYTTVKYDADGNEQWVKRFNGSGNNDDIPAGMCVMNEQEYIFITGTSNNDYATLIYEPTSDEPIAKNIETNLPDKIALQQNYPNPFNPSTNISFSVPRSMNVSLNIYDDSGRLVESLVNGFISGGTHSVTWDASKLTSGIYFYKLIGSDNYNETRKMVLLK